MRKLTLVGLTVLLGATAFAGSASAQGFDDYDGDDAGFDLDVDDVAALEALARELGFDLGRGFGDEGGPAGPGAPCDCADADGPGQMMPGQMMPQVPGYPSAPGQMTPQAPGYPSAPGQTMPAPPMQPGATAATGWQAELMTLLRSPGGWERLMAFLSSPEVWAMMLGPGADAAFDVPGQEPMDGPGPMTPGQVGPGAPAEPAPGFEPSPGGFPGAAPAPTTPQADPEHAGLDAAGDDAFGGWW